MQSVTPVRQKRRNPATHLPCARSTGTRLLPLPGTARVAAVAAMARHRSCNAARHRAIPQGTTSGVRDRPPCSPGRWAAVRGRRLYGRRTDRRPSRRFPDHPARRTGAYASRVRRAAARRPNSGRADPVPRVAGARVFARTPRFIRSVGHSVRSSIWRIGSFRIAPAKQA